MFDWILSDRYQFLEPFNCMQNGGVVYYRIISVK